MRTNVVIDDRLMSQALKKGGYPTKRSALEAGLRLLVQLHSQREMRKFRGKVKWVGNLEKMRRD